MKRSTIKIALPFFAVLVFTQCRTPFRSLQTQFLNDDSSMVLVAAHRAAHIVYPENSLPAIRQAIDLGVDIVELDVQVSKDGIPVLMHDRTIDRTTTGSGKIPDYTLVELKSLRLRHHNGVTDYQIPTLEEALRLARNKILVDVDLKTGTLEPIVEVVKKTHTIDQVFFFDNDYDALQWIETDNPDHMLMPRVYSQEMADSALVLFDPEVIHIDFDCYDEKMTKSIKAEHARIWINALGDVDEALGTDQEDAALDRILQFGANIFQTDKPEVLIRALEKRNRRE
ncbi:MAG: glycerophosphodiester phosphodiesterase family protein [Saprospiraceae bacterium]|nr:glycerophosphodiester phosphodiesterase family protein [Saprospiraceae bacterium]